MLLVDRFPRPKYVGFGLFGCMVTLSIEAALVAQFIPSTNESALEAAVAMFFIFLGFYELCINGTQWSWIGKYHYFHRCLLWQRFCNDPWILMLIMLIAFRRALPIPPSRQGSLSRCCKCSTGQFDVAASYSYRICQYRMAVLYLFHRARYYRCCCHVFLVS